MPSPGLEMLIKLINYLFKNIFIWLCQISVATCEIFSCSMQTLSCGMWGLVAQTVKSLPAMQETWVQFLGQEYPLEKGMATPSRILAWRMLWTEQPGRLQSMGLQRVGHNSVTKHTLSSNPVSRFSFSSFVNRETKAWGSLDKPVFAVPML